MRERLWTWIGAILIVGALAYSASFTAVDTAKYHGKTGIKALTGVIDSNNALISGGTLDQTQVTLATGGTIIKSTSPSEVQFEFTNAAALLGGLVADTSQLTGAIGDNSYYHWVISRAPDSASNDVDYVSIDGVITDETTATMDSLMKVLSYVAGSLVTNLVVGNNVVGPDVDDSVDLGASGKEFKDAYIDGTANIDTLSAGAATVSGVLTLTETQAATTVTAAATNFPALVDSDDAVFVKITISGEVYVMPVFQLDD